MKKVISWVASSFFRQAGRFLFYIVLGGMLFLLFKANDFKLNFADILLPMHVKADTMYLDGYDTQWYFNNRSTRLPTNGPFQYNTQYSGSINSGFQVSEFYTKSDNPMPTQVIRGGEFIVPLYVQAPVIYRDDTISDQICTKWEQSGSVYSCTNISNSALTHNVNYITPNLTIWAMAVYTSGYTDMCTIDLSNNKLLCPVADIDATNSLWFIQVRTIIYYDNYNNTQQQYYVGLGDKTNRYKNVSQAIIDNQNQNTNQTLNFFSDTNTTSSSDTTSNFFSETNSTSESALTSIVSAPLTLINSLVVGTHESICATLNSKQICLPSGDIIWNRATSSQNHGGSGVHDHWFRGGSVEQFIAFFNLVVGGFILYKCLLSIFNMVHKLLDPANSWVGVMKL